MLKALTTVGVAILVLIAAIPAEGWTLTKTTVRVENDLGATTFLLFHCKSTDTDLGQHLISNGAYIDWSFRPNIRGTTLYWCAMKWNGLERDFAIYDASKDEGNCAAKCWRSIRPDGAYFYHEYKNYWEKRFTWGLEDLANSTSAQGKNETN